MSEGGSGNNVTPMWASAAALHGAQAWGHVPILVAVSTGRAFFDFFASHGRLQGPRCPVSVGSVLLLLVSRVGRVSRETGVGSSGLHEASAALGRH